MSPHSGRIFLCLYFEVSVGVCLLLGCSANGKASKFPKGALRLSPWFSEKKENPPTFQLDVSQAILCPFSFLRPSRERGGFLSTGVPKLSAVRNTGAIQKKQIQTQSLACTANTERGKMKNKIKKKSKANYERACTDLGKRPKESDWRGGRNSLPLPAAPRLASLQGGEDQGVRVRVRVRAGSVPQPPLHARLGARGVPLGTGFGGPLTYLHSKDQRNVSAVQLKSHPTFSKTICDCRSLNSYFGERGGKLKNRHCQQVPSSGGLCRRGGRQRRRREKRENRGEGEED